MRSVGGAVGISWDDLRPGLRNAQVITLNEAQTVPAVLTGFADMPAVFATAFMMGFVASWRLR
jgi:fluoroacetyl-CoA thioesterase